MGLEYLRRYRVDPPPWPRCLRKRLPRPHRGSRRRPRQRGRRASRHRKRAGASPGGIAVLMQFERRLREGIHDGSITLAFRRWRRSQVTVGRRYRTGLDLVEVVSLDEVDPASISAADARRAGYASVEALRTDLRGDGALPLYRIEFRRLD